jgi:putative hydrolase of the HAD superfamily
MKIDWNNIDTVLLDMDGTILDLGFDNFFWLEHLPAVYADKNNLSLNDSHRFFEQAYNSKRGTLEWYCIDFWTDFLKLDIPKLKREQKHRVAFRPNAIEFLKFLNQEGKKTYLATNAHPKSLEVKLLAADFKGYFEDLNSSHEFGYPKEEQEYWMLLQEKYNFDSNRTLFIDDNLTVLKSAQKYGISHLLSIDQPDLNKPPVNCEPFQSINDFSSIMLTN